MKTIRKTLTAGLILALITCMLSGCGVFEVLKLAGNLGDAKDTVEATASPTKVPKATPDTDGEPDVPSSMVSPYTNGNILVGQKSVRYVDEDGQIQTIYAFDGDEIITFANVYENYLGAFYNIGDDYSTQKLLIYDGKEVVYDGEIPPEFKFDGFVSPIGMYMDGFYYYAHDYENDTLTIALYSLVDKTFEISEEYTTLHNMIYNDGEKTLMYEQNVLSQLENGKYIYSWNSESGIVKVYEPDGNYKTEYDLSSYDLGTWEYVTNDRAVARTKYPMTGDQIYSYYYVNLENGDCDYIDTLSMDEAYQFNITGIDDEYIYSCYSDLYVDDLSKVDSFYRRKIDGSDEATLIGSFGRLPGLSDYYSDNSRFKVINDKYYVYGSDSKCFTWFEANIGDIKPQAVSTPDYELPYAKYGELTSRAGKYYIEDTDIIYHEEYIESFRFNDDVKNADVMNEVLKERDDIVNEYADSMRESALNDVSELLEDTPDFPYHYSYENTFSFVKDVGNRLVELSYNSYDYYGGAHGMPYFTYYYFDKSTGENLTLEDICPLTEEEFKDLVARASVEDWKKDSERYYDSYDESLEKEHYDSFREFVNFDSAIVQFDEDRAYFYYPPYAFGPFASGFIDIPLEYKDLKIDIN